jgi:hypothetical protein
MNIRTSIVAAALAAAFAWSAPAFAHCDTLDGPVVSAARNALDTGKIEHVLIWVQPDDEPQIRDAFGKARAVRKSGGASAELADRYFYETLVRVHRAGEGAPYTGLKPAGDIEPPVAAADKALATQRLEDVAKLIEGRTHAGLHEHYDAVVRTKDFKASDVKAGRDHVGAYVAYVHYVERLYDAAGTAKQAHAPEARGTPHGH